MGSAKGLGQANLPVPQVILIKCDSELLVLCRTIVGMNEMTFIKMQVTSVVPIVLLAMVITRKKFIGYVLNCFLNFHLCAFSHFLNFHSEHVSLL